MWLHSFKNTFRYLLRQRAMLFWALIFPIVLGVFFKLAFGNITEMDKFKTIDVAVNENLMKDENFKRFMKEMEDEEYFHVTEAKDKDVLDEKMLLRPISNQWTRFIRRSRVYLRPWLRP